MPSWILAIDFGTSYTVAAARVDGRAPEIIEISGERRMPSVVMVDPDGGMLVGRAADDLSVTNPGSTLRALKNRLGDQTPAILGGRPHQVVTLVAALLREVYEQVVQQMGEPPTEVRLTHPATWNQPRNNRLIEAAAKAGLPQPLLVPEPVAAALSYAADVGLAPGESIVVYDLGGGTFDSAVVTAREGGFSVVGRPGGDQHIGGELFDELVVNHIGEMLDPDVWDAIQVGDDPLWRQVGAALRNEARKAKEALSSHPYANLLLPLPAGLWQVRFTREAFSDLVRPYIAETITTLDRCLEEAGVRRKQLAGISLVGGSSRSPIVEEMVREAFPMISISRRGDPKATVAAGATLAERPSSEIPGLWRSPVTQGASPGTAHEPVRLAPPPISQPPEAPVSYPPSPPPVSQPPPTPSIPPSPPIPSSPTGAPTPPNPPTVAVPIGGFLQPGSSGPVRKNRKRLLIVVGVLVATAIAAGVVLATRSDDSSGGNNTQSTSPAPGGSTGAPDSASVSTEPDTEPDTGPETTSDSTENSEPDSTTAPESTDSSPTFETIPTSTIPQDEPTGTKVATFAGHSAEVLAASFSSDGSRLVTAGLDRLGIVWDAETGEQVSTLTGHLDEVYSADFSPDGKMVATTGADATVRLWEAKSGDELYTFTGHTDVVFQVSFSPEGNQLLSASRDGTARLWDIPTGTEAALFVGSTEAVYSAEFSPDGSMVVAGGQDDVVRVWDVSAPGSPRSFVGHIADVQTASFSPDQTLIVSASDDGTAKVWDAIGGRLIYDFAHDFGVTSASFSQDGTQVITSSIDRSAKIWDVASGNLLHALLGHTDTVFGAAFSPDGSQAVTASADGTAKLWDVASGSLIVDLSVGAPVAGAGFNPDGSMIVTVSNDGNALLWAT